MKKILFIALFVLAVIELNAHGACLVEQLKLKQTCTGGAVPVLPESQNGTYSDKETLKEMYSPPTMSVPMQNNNNGYPMVNPSVNCMFGVCIPK